jgi:hypothetical protein
MLTSPFLTDIDSRAAIKGSRDPLGLQTIWTRLGRQVVGNLTTVTTSVRDFTTLVLGYHFAERVAGEGGGESDLAVFLKWEQLAAYARSEINNDWAFRGVHRVKRNLEEPSRILIGTHAAAQILSDQKTYGLWGLYTVPARSSGLVEGDPTRLTEAGRFLVERVYLPIFTREGFKNGSDLVERLSKPAAVLDLARRDRAVIAAIAKTLVRQLLAAERQIYRDHLLLGLADDRTGGCQAVLAEALESTLGQPSWALSPESVRRLARTCASAGGAGETVVYHLERIRTCEFLLAPAAALFDLLLGCDGQTIAAVVRDVRKQWGRSLRTIDIEATQALGPELRDAQGDPESGDRWVQIARCLADGDYGGALKLLVVQNRAVMKARAGAGAWVDEEGGKLKVRFRDETEARFPEQSEFPGYWRHPYFIDSLRRIAADLRE